MASKRCFTPLQDIISRTFNQDIAAHVRNDNAAAVQAIENGYSIALRYMKKTQRTSLSFLHCLYFESNDSLFSLSKASFLRPEGLLNAPLGDPSED